MNWYSITTRRIRTTMWKSKIVLMDRELNETDDIDDGDDDATPHFFACVALQHWALSKAHPLRTRIMTLHSIVLCVHFMRIHIGSSSRSQWTCKDFLKIGTLQNAFLFYQKKSGWRFGEKCSYAHRLVDEQPTNRSKKEWWQKSCGYAEERKLARKRTCHRPMSRSTGETWEEGW